MGALSRFSLIINSDVCENPFTQRDVNKRTVLNKRMIEIKDFSAPFLYLAVLLSNFTHINQLFYPDRKGFNNKNEVE
jgi:hypothetical protein